MGELDSIISQLRKKGGLLENPETMSDFCNNNESTLIESQNRECYGFKIETGNHSYYIRCSQAQSNLDFDVYGYDRNQLNQFMEDSQHSLQNQQQHMGGI